MSKNLKKILVTGASLLMMASVGAGMSNIASANGNGTDGSHTDDVSGTPHKIERWNHVVGADEDQDGNMSSFNRALGGTINANFNSGRARFVYRRGHTLEVVPEDDVPGKIIRVDGHRVYTPHQVLARLRSHHAHRHYYRRPARRHVRKNVKRSHRHSHKRARRTHKRHATVLKRHVTHTNGTNSYKNGYKFGLTIMNFNTDNADSLKNHMTSWSNGSQFKKGFIKGYKVSANKNFDEDSTMSPNQAANIAYQRMKNFNNNKSSKDYRSGWAAVDSISKANPNTLGPTFEKGFYDAYYYMDAMTGESTSAMTKANALRSAYIKSRGYGPVVVAKH